MHALLLALLIHRGNVWQHRCPALNPHCAVVQLAPSWSVPTHINWGDRHPSYPGTLPPSISVPTQISWVGRVPAYPGR